MAEPNKRKVLVIDDDPLVRHLVKAYLTKDGYEVIEADSGAEGLEQANAHRPDIILLDLIMPGMDGFDVCQQLRQNTGTANVPVIMLTALNAPDDKVRGLRTGADDYVTKPFNLDELRTRIEAHLRRSARDLGASPLTSLPGNPLIEQVMRARLAAREPLAVLYIDLTNFKAYNDEYGWLRGDEIIKLLAKTLVDSVASVGRREDFVGHIGGDDFVVMTDVAHAAIIAQEVIDRFDAMIPQYYDEQARARGYIQVFDRQGKPFCAPIASVAIAVATNENRELTHPLQVASLAAEVKKRVKAIPGSHYAFDRRRK